MILFCSLIGPHQFKKSNFQHSWLLNCLKINVIIIRAHETFDYFCLFGQLNYVLNKVIQIKSFFYNNLLRELSFPANIGNHINSQTNLSFIHHNFISGLLVPNNVFLLLQGTTKSIENFFNKKEDHSKWAYYINIRTKGAKF